MCGICGMVALDGNTRIHREVLSRMNERLRHRGPDGEGEFLDVCVGLAMRRLAILDVQGGGQPVFNEDRTVAVVYNGEIYNAPELRKRLEANGHTFRSHTDTEVLVHLYEDQGEGFIEALRGMFAFAIWDKPNRTLLLARDRIGKKPLYYAQAKSLLAFASELNALRACPEITLSLNEEEILKALVLQYIPSPGTPFHGVHKLPPGHLLTVRNGAVEVKRYWRLTAAPSSLSYQEARTNLDEQLKEAVRLRLLSDVPLGALLSGGVDSSGVVALMAKMAPKVATFSVRFDHPGGEEDARFALEVAEKYGCDHHELHVGDAEAIEAIPRVFDALDEPILDPACLPTYLICRMAREYVTVVLTGEGGDEAFAGYARYRLARMPILPGQWLRAAVDQAFTHELISTRHVKGFHAITEPDVPTSHTFAVSAFAPSEHRRLFRRDVSWIVPVFRPLFAAHPGSDRLNQTLAVDIETWLADDLLQKVDRMSMAVSLEARTPLLDHKLLEYAHSLPGAYKLNGKTHKRIFKDALAGLLPPELLARRKVGFEPPWGAWFRGHLKEILRDALASRPFRSWAFIDHTEVNRLLERHQRTGRYGLQLYCLFALAEWGRRHAASA